MISNNTVTYYTSNPSTNPDHIYVIGFVYDQTPEVRVRTQDSGSYVEVTNWTFKSSTEIQFSSDPPTTFEIYRITNLSLAYGTPQHSVFYPGTTIAASQLNGNFELLRRGIEENQNVISSLIFEDSSWFDGLYVDKTGDHMTGALTLGTTNSVGAANIKLNTNGDIFTKGQLVVGDNTIPTIAGESNLYLGNYDSPADTTLEPNIRVGTNDEFQFEIESDRGDGTRSNNLFFASPTAVGFNVNGDSASPGTIFYYNYSRTAADQYCYFQVNNGYLHFTGDKLGINTQNPTNQLHIYDGTAANDQAELKIESFRPGIRFQDRSASSSSSEIIGDNGLQFNVSAPVDDDTTLTERMRLTNSGRLLIGTSASRSVGAQRLFQVESTSSNSGISVIRHTIGTGGPVLAFCKTRGDDLGDTTLVDEDDQLGHITFGGGDGVDLHSKGAEIKAFVDGIAAAGDMPGRLEFSTTPSGSDVATPRMTIKSDGNVGIGTTSPGALLDLGTSTPILRFSDTGTTGYHQIQSSNSNFIINADPSNVDTNSSISFNIDGSPKAQIDSLGNVGIGSTSPSTYSSKLVVADGSVGEETTLVITNNAVNQFARLGINGDEAQLVWDNADSCVFGTTSEASDSGINSEKMRIDSSGNVGIGESNPVSKLIIKNTSSNDGMRIISSTTGEGFVLFGDTADNNTGGIVYNHTNDELEFLVNNGPRMLIDSSGQVLVGLTDDQGSGNLQVKETIAACRASNSTSSSQNIGTINFSDTRPGTYAYIKCQSDGTPGTNNYPGRLIFATTEDGASTPTPTVRMVIDNSGRVRVGNHTSFISSFGAFQVSNTSGQIRSYVNSESLADGEYAAVFARGENTSSVARQIAIGVYKNASLTNTVGYIFMDQQDGGNSYLWTDDSGVLRISNTGTHRGTTNGTVVGAQTSDERLKNIGDDVSYGLTEVKQLQPKQYALKTEPDTNKLGFIAQEVESIIPEAVFDTNEELEGHQEGDRTKLGMEYVQLIPVLVNAIKELSIENDALKERLNAAGI